MQYEMICKAWEFGVGKMALRASKLQLIVPGSDQHGRCGSYIRWEGWSLLNNLYLSPFISITKLP